MKSFLLFFVTVAYGATEYLVYFGDHEMSQYETVQQRTRTREEYEDDIVYIGFSEGYGHKFVLKPVLDGDGEFEIYTKYNNHHNLILESDELGLVLVSDGIPSTTATDNEYFVVVGDILVNSERNPLCFSPPYGLHLESQYRYCQCYLTVRDNHLVKSSIIPQTSLMSTKRHQEIEHHVVEPVQEEYTDIAINFIISSFFTIILVSLLLFMIF